MESQYKYQMKPQFKDRMQTLLPNSADFKKFVETIHTSPQNFIRCNTIKISPKDLLSRLNKKWKVKQPFKKHPEIMLITSQLSPGEIGNAVEHILGYYYVQEISSMLPAISLDPKPNEFILDLFASPGSKTTQIAARMENTGTLIANDLTSDRIRILMSNLERCSVLNTIVSQNDAVQFTKKLQKFHKFDKILLDAPCSGEGTLRSSPETFNMWNPKMISKFSRLQKKFLSSAIKLLKKGGTLVYSTCTHSPEENEEIVSFALEKFPLKAETLSLPLKCREGITNWENNSFHKDTKKACRIYPHDNNSEGFFISKFTLKKEVK